MSGASPERRPGLVSLDPETLYEVIGVIASSPDLDRVLDGVVDVLSRATGCHACFVYLRDGEQLNLAAASRVYAHVVGRVRFGVDQGLAGWAVRNNRPAFVRDHALDDPRHHDVPELDEERFQSIAAVPIPSRGGTVLGVIVLHTIAPREFDDGTVALLGHAAPLIAGVIENAQLYADARRRVAALTALSSLSTRIAAARGRDEIYRTAVRGVRTLLTCREARVYETTPDRHRLALVAEDPPAPVGAPSDVPTSGVLLDALQQRRDDDSRALHDLLSLDPAAPHAVAVPITTGDEHRGVLVLTTAERLHDDAGDLLQALCNQLGLAVKTTELIERLTEENVVDELFAALDAGHTARAEALARRARLELSRAFVVVQVSEAAAGAAEPRDAWARRAETALRRIVAGVLCDADGDRVRALLPLASGGGDDELGRLDSALTRFGGAEQAAIGRSQVHRSADDGPRAIGEAGDAARVAAALDRQGGLRAYERLGAYRYLVHLADADGPADALHAAVQALAWYDRRRNTELLATLERYLATRRSIADTARLLTVHPNTLRQRLERIETVTELRLADADLLDLELAIKLVHLRGRPPMPAG